MLLDRKRVKFWQRWVFLGMAFVMVFFLFMYSGVTGCHNNGTGQSSNIAEKQLQKLKKQIADNPNDLTSVLNLAEIYKTRATNGDKTGSSAQTKDVQQAASYYELWLTKQAAQKGATARQARAEVLSSLATFYGTMNNNWSKTNNAYDRLTQLYPNDPDYFLGWGQAAANAGENSAAVLAWGRYLVLVPHGPNSAYIRAWIKKTTSSPSPSPSPTTSGSAKP